MENVISTSFFGSSLVKLVARSLRLHHWAKNLLIFVPLIAAHRLMDVILVKYLLIAFVSFSLCSSGVYIVNDILDLENDRDHPIKKNRPFASGALSIRAGIIMALALFAVSAFCALIMNWSFLLILIMYFFISLFYSLYLKKIVIMDIIILASLFSLRIFAGGVVIGFAISQWLMAFSTFLFLSLATMKRYVELQDHGGRNLSNVLGRGYDISDLNFLSILGIVSGYISILVLALYTTSVEVKVLYAHPDRLWLLQPVVFYWISRVWYIAKHGAMHDDPIDFALRDRISYFSMVVFLSIIVWST